MSRHEFIVPTEAAVVLHDTETGERWVPVASFLAGLRERIPGITEPQLIAKMEAHGWRWERKTATGPDGSTATVDFFAVPGRWPTA